MGEICVAVLVRVTRSRFWALRGLEVFKLQIFARWGSNAILRYVADVPLFNITGEVSGSSASPGQAARSLTDILETHVRDAQNQVDTLRREIDSIRRQLHPSYVRNVQSGVWHYVLQAGLGTPPTEWRTMCGWRFGLRPHALSTDPPGAEACWCDRCALLHDSGGDFVSGGSASESG